MSEAALRDFGVSLTRAAADQIRRGLASRNQPAQFSDSLGAKRSAHGAAAARMSG